jgi:hypothetical protein
MSRKSISIVAVAALLLLAGTKALAVEPMTDAGIKAKYSQSYDSPPIKVIYTLNLPAQYPKTVADFLKYTVRVRNRTTCALGPADDGSSGVMLRLPARWQSVDEIDPQKQGLLKQIAKMLAQKLGTSVQLVVVRAGTNQETFRTSSQ